MRTPRGILQLRDRSCLGMAFAKNSARPVNSFPRRIFSGTAEHGLLGHESFEYDLLLVRRLCVAQLKGERFEVAGVARISRPFVSEDGGIGFCSPRLLEESFTLSEVGLGLARMF